MKPCLLLFLVLVLARSSAADKPNVVFILADDLGYGDLSCYGATKIETPNIDRLAKEGMRFTDAHSPHSVCTPTRYSLLTGRYCWRTWAKSRGVWSNDPLLIDTGRLTLPKLFRGQGYQTACVGKWHLGFGSPDTPGWDDAKGPDYNLPLKPGPLEIGFDYFFGVPHVGQLPHVFIEDDRVVNLDPADPLRIILDERTLERSSYLKRFQFAPGHRFTGGEAATYQQEEVTKTLTAKAEDWLEANVEEPFFLYFAPRNVHAPLRPNRQFKGKSGIGPYGDFILELDWSVGRLLNKLDQLGIAGKTAVFLSSDNGAVQLGHVPADRVDYRGHLANGGWRGQKTEVYEGGHRVPLLVRWPHLVEAGSTSDHLVALTDVLATFAQYFELELPEGAGEDSVSFFPSLKGGSPTRLSLVHDSNRGMFAIRRGKWKLITFQGGGGIGWTAEVDRNLPRAQLYDLKADPGETRNLYHQHPETVDSLRRLLDDTVDLGSSTK